ncbi:MAG: ABC transporter permease, partial [Rubrivivax sp.]
MVPSATTSSGRTEPSKMRTPDLLAFAIGAARGNRMRTALLMLAMAIGVAAVVTLTALGDGARRYVVREFSA